jgi:two-component system chemotaxis sensor kinase CheA
MDDLIGEFITETTENLATLDLELVKLEQNPEDTAILGNIFRTMHTIKGTCGFLGLGRLESVAHASENVLGKIRDKKLDASEAAVSLVLESLDNIKGLIEHLSEHGEEPQGSDADLIARLNQFAETGVVGGKGEAPKPAAVEQPAAVNGAVAPAGEASFPHFCGEDDPEMAAAIAKLMAEQAAEAAAQAPEPAQPTAVVLPMTPVQEAPKAQVAKPAAKDDHGTAKEGGGGANQSIRVNIDVLENLMQMVSELVLTRNQLLQVARTKEDKDFLTPLQQLSHITSELQDGVMKTRMQPIGNAWSKFPRLIRDLSHELGKKIELKMIGEDTELDRQLLEVIKDPLTHMVRNSCDHGLETPADRKAAGKTEEGTVTLSAYHEGGHIIIEIIDDGRGINIERVKQKALQNGMATEAQLAAMSEKQIAQFIFGAGFSTAETVTSVSGRGVGMDVVRTNIEKIGGTIELDSKWGHGSKVAIKIPLTLAIVSVLLVEACGQKFAIPQINVVELVRVSQGANLALETINDSLVLRLRDKLLPLAVMTEVLGFPCDHKELMKKQQFIAVCRVGGYDFGVVVDHVFDTEEIVVKPVANVLKSITVYSGNTILGDGSVIMILDPNGIAKSIGNIEISSRAETALSTGVQAHSDSMVGFLLFNMGKGAPKAVPLELVSRLEEIDVSTIEVAGDFPVVQYRGELMQLKTMDPDFKMPDEGNVDVIVFSYDKKVVGLVVTEIVDIIHSQFAIKMSSKEGKEQGYLGSMVIGGRTTDVIDVGYILAGIVDQVIKDANTSPHKQESNILLVEDSPFFRNLTVPFLASAGYKITAAEDAEQALKILSSSDFKFDMMVTDIEMPGMNGIELANACRSLPQAAGLPIIAYTASLSNETVKLTRDVGMKDCIVKTDRPGLLQAVAHHLAQHKKPIKEASA